jgi:hypothetical protein
MALAIYEYSPGCCFKAFPSTTGDLDLGAGDFDLGAGDLLFNFGLGIYSLILYPFSSLDNEIYLCSASLYSFIFSNWSILLALNSAIS